MNESHGDINLDLQERRGEWAGAGCVQRNLRRRMWGDVSRDPGTAGGGGGGGGGGWIILWQ